MGVVHERGHRAQRWDAPRVSAKPEHVLELPRITNISQLASPLRLAALLLEHRSHFHVRRVLLDGMLPAKQTNCS